MVKRAGAFPYGKAIFNGFQYISFREHHRLVQAAPERELRGNGRRKRAARSVGVFGANVIAAQRERLGAIEKQIDGLVHVAALDDHGASPALDQFAGRGLHPAQILDLHSREQCRLGNVGRDHRSPLHQFVRDVFHSGGVEQVWAAGRRLHHWVQHDIRKVSFVEKLRHNTAIGAIAQHADLHRSDVQILRQHLELRP